MALYESTPGATYKSIAADLGIKRAPCVSGSCGTANGAVSPSLPPLRAGRRRPGPGRRRRRPIRTSGSGSWKPGCPSAGQMSGSWRPSGTSCAGRRSISRRRPTGESLSVRLRSPGAYGVKRLCEVLGLHRSSYCKWLTGRKARAARQRDDPLPFAACRFREVRALGRASAREVAWLKAAEPGERIRRPDGGTHTARPCPGPRRHPGATPRRRRPHPPPKVVSGSTRRCAPWPTAARRLRGRKRLDDGVASRDRMEFPGLVAQPARFIWPATPSVARSLATPLERSRRPTGFWVRSGGGDPAL
ncbi:hypothetical protein QF027_000243 [Streptomyces canus]|nr:hypothetical protein [Streptomyces canus]